MRNPAVTPRERGQARIIRRVIKRDAKRNPKVARDYKILYDLERIKALKARPCTFCPDLIEKGTFYARTSTTTDESEVRNMKQIHGILIPAQHDYHPGCVPHKIKPLVRLLFR